MNSQFAKIFCAIALCGSGTGVANTDDALECAQKAVGVLSQSKDLAVKLCTNGGTVKSVECAAKATGELGFSADQAVELCANKVLRLENMVHFSKDR